MKALLVNSLEGLPAPYRTGKLRGTEARRAWVCPAGVDPDKLSDRDRREQCRSVTLAGLPRKSRSSRKKRTSSRRKK